MLNTAIWRDAIRQLLRDDPGVIAPLVSQGPAPEDTPLCAWTSFLINNRELERHSISDLMTIYLIPAIQSYIRTIDEGILEHVYQSLLPISSPCLPNFTQANADTNLKDAKKILNLHHASTENRNLIYGPRSEREILMAGDVVRQNGFHSYLDMTMENMASQLSLAWHKDAIALHNEPTLSILNLDGSDVEVMIKSFPSITIPNPSWIILFGQHSCQNSQTPCVG